MSLPVTQADGVYTHVYPVEDIGLLPTGTTFSLTGSQTVTATSQFSTGMPATLLIVALVSSSTNATMNVQVGASGFTPTYTGATNTAITLSGTGTTYSAGVVNTAFVFDDTTAQFTGVSITTDQRFVAVQIVNGAAPMVITSLAIFVMYEYTRGEDWFTGIRAAANGVANRTVGDGAGTVYLGPAFANNPYELSTFRF